MGYGGNYNFIICFCCYDGDELGIINFKVCFVILKEYMDVGYLLKLNYWYYIKIINENNRVSYYIDGECLVDFRDVELLWEGWFGFCIILLCICIINFSYECLL